MRRGPKAWGIGRGRVGRADCLRNPVLRSGNKKKTRARSSLAPRSATSVQPPYCWKHRLLPTDDQSDVEVRFHLQKLCAQPKARRPEMIVP
jgi:hypothetical protein